MAKRKTKSTEDVVINPPQEDVILGAPSANNEIVTYTDITDKLGEGSFKSNECPTKAEILAKYTTIAKPELEPFGSNELVTEVAIVLGFVDINIVQRDGTSLVVTIDGNEYTSGTHQVLAGSTVKVKVTYTGAAQDKIILSTGQTVTSGTSTDVVITQAGDFYADCYKFTIAATANVSYTGDANFSIAMTSTKNLAFFNSITSTGTQPWMTVSSYSATAAILNVSQNTGIPNRSTTLTFTQAESGLSGKTVLSQRGRLTYISWNAADLTNQPWAGANVYRPVSYDGYYNTGSVVTSSAPDWLSYSNGTIIIAGNSDLVNGRTGTLTLSSNKAGVEVQGDATITVSQVKKDNITWDYTISVNPTTYTVGSSGGTSTAFTVTSKKQKKVNGVITGSPEDAPWSGTSNKSWITWSDSTRKITVSSSKDETAATGAITLSNDGASCTIAVTRQAHVPTWVLNFYNKSIPTGNAGGAGSVYVESTKDGASTGWSVISQTGNVITGLSPTSGTSGTRMTFTVPTNSSTSSRTWSIVIAQSGNGAKTATLSSTQDGQIVVTYGNYKLSASPSSFSVSASSTSRQYFTVTSTRDVYHNGSYYTTENVGYNVNNGNESYTYGGNYSTDQGYIYINSANTSTSSTRSGSVTVTQNSSGKTVNVSITQASAAPPPDPRAWWDSTSSLSGTYSSGMKFTRTFSTAEGGYVSSASCSGGSASVSGSTVTITPSSTSGSVSLIGGGSTRVTNGPISFNVRDSYTFSGYSNQTATKDGGTLNVTGTSLKYNFGYTSGKTASIKASSNQSWASVSISGTTVVVTVQGNTSTSSRTATITVTQDGSGNRKTFTVTQAAAPQTGTVRFVDSNTITISASGGTFSKGIVYSNANVKGAGVTSS